VWLLEAYQDDKGDKMSKVYQTMWSELQFTKIEPGCWMFLNEGHQVGRQYPTREMLIMDMARYAKDSWGLEL
jgi:hypothetical protein